MESAAPVDGNALDKFFKFSRWDTSIRRDTLAGLTTFMVMAYIIFVNPNILGLGGAPEGLPFAAALTSTCLVAGVMTIIMGLFTNRAYAIAPGMGLNAVVAFSLVLGQGLTMENAMGIIFLEGVAITILVLTGFREAIFKSIPLELKKAIVVGIGFFILFIGLVDAGFINVNGGTPVALVEFGTVPMAPLTVSIFGLGITIAMMALKWKPAILLGIVFSTLFAIVLNYAMGKDVGFLPGTAVVPDKIVESPDFSLIGAFDFGAFDKLGVAAAVLWVFSLMLSDFFDTMGTLVGVGGQAGYLDEKGEPAAGEPPAARRLAGRRGRRRRELVVGDDLHRVGRRRRRRRPHRLGLDRGRGALPARHVLLAHRRRRAGAGDGGGADRRRLLHDGDPDQGGGGRRGPVGGNARRRSTSATSPSASPPSSS